MIFFFLLKYLLVSKYLLISRVKYILLWSYKLYFWTLRKVRLVTVAPKISVGQIGWPIYKLVMPTVGYVWTSVAGQFFCKSVAFLTDFEHKKASTFSKKVTVYQHGLPLWRERWIWVEERENWGGSRKDDAIWVTTVHSLIKMRIGMTITMEWKNLFVYNYIM